jgi:hypothetical protein
MTLQEWMEIAGDLIEDFKDKSVDDGGYSDDELKQYKHFTKIAHSIMAVIHTLKEEDCNAK